MGAPEQYMSTESIIKEFNGTQYSEDLREFLDTEDICFEVIDGIIRVKQQPLSHDVTKKVLSNLIENSLSSRGLDCESMPEIRLIRGSKYSKDYLIPDISVLNWEECDYGDNGMCLGIPKLVVEILSSNRKDEQFKKRLIYQEMKIPEYWIVDLDAKGVLQLVLEGAEYNKKPIMYLGGKISHHECGMEVNLDELFLEVQKRLDRLGKKSDTTNFFEQS